MTKARRLRELLRRSRPLVLCGVHDGLSAALAERAGFEALWASGFCISASKRIPDVGLVTMTEHLAATREIDRASTLPVVADVDDGFGDAVMVTRTVREYEAAGIAGMCMEDSRHPKRCSLFGELEHRLVSPQAFAGKIRAARATRTDPDFVIIARIEALVADLGVEEALTRGRLYADAGADCILVHSKERDPAKLEEFARRWDDRRPLVAVPSRYPQVSVPELQRIGYKVVIFANQGLRAAIAAMDRVFRRLVETQTLAAVEGEIAPLEEIFDLAGFDQVRQVEERFLGPGGDAPEGAADEPAVETLPGALLDARPVAGAGRTALTCGARSWSYAELRGAVDASADAIAALGVGRGDRVMLVLPNSPEFVAAFLAVTRLGAIAVPVDFQAGPERLEFVAGDTTPRLCLLPPDRELPAGFSVPAHAVTLAAGEAGLTVDPPAPEPATVGSRAEVQGADAAVILFSAGSTGRPKGAVIEHRQLLQIARILIDVVGMDDEHRELILSPMTHSGGWQRVTSTLLAGGQVVVAEPPLSIPGLLEDVQDHGIRGFFAAPPVLRALMASPPDRVRQSLACLRSIESASAPLAPNELSRLMDLLPQVQVLFQYGLTECSRALFLDTRAHPDRLHTVGLPAPGVEVRIAVSGGASPGPGAKGEILLAAPQRAQRYWNRPDLDRDRLQGRWLHTGDVGSLDAEGFLTFHGRSDDMINCGGLSFFPAEVERELGAVEGVSDYIVAGVLDPKGVMGQVPWAFVVPASPAQWKPAGFNALARKRLPPHMVPRRVVVLASMPLIASGKPDRRRVVIEYGPNAPA